MKTSYEITNFDTLETVIVSTTDQIKLSVRNWNQNFTAKEIIYQVNKWVEGGSMWSLSMGNVTITKK
jgi:hypothetical protein